jgi:hypothetical protein
MKLTLKPQDNAQVTLQLIIILINIGNMLLQPLTFPQPKHNLPRLTIRLKGITLHTFPMIKHRLRERLTTRRLTNIGREPERLVDGQIRLDRVERGTRALFFGEDVTSSSVEDGVDAAHGCVGTEDFDEEDGFLEGGLREEFCGVEDAAAGGDDLASSSVDGVGVEGDVLDIESDTSHGLFRNTAFFRCPTNS